MLKCLIAFILGWFLCKHMGNGFRVGGGSVFSPAIRFFKHGRNKISQASGWTGAKKDAKKVVHKVEHLVNPPAPPPHKVKCPPRENITQHCDKKKDGSKHCKLKSCSHGTSPTEDCATRYSWTTRGKPGDPGPIRCTDANNIYYRCADGNQCFWDKVNLPEIAGQEEKHSDDKVNLPEIAGQEEKYSDDILHRIQKTAEDLPTNSAEDGDNG